MRKINNLLSALFLILVFTASITFSYLNTTLVEISIGALELPPQPVSAWIIGSFVSGGIIGLLLGLGIFKNLKSKSEIRRLRKQLDDAGEEISQLRVMSLKDL
ncbi:MAG: lipopolysaccharide assembly protein LapA domain-containing protein [Pseudomonadales bacterium]|nr:lipopolysaccharide assembly protein LapA domain-containing protein [Pseudomonadales bacterium]